MGAGQIAQQAKCLLYKNKDLKLSPHTFVKLGVEVHLSVSSALGVWNQEDPKTLLAGWCAPTSARDSVSRGKVKSSRRK